MCGKLQNVCHCSYRVSAMDFKVETGDKNFSENSGNSSYRWCDIREIIFYAEARKNLVESKHITREDDRFSSSKYLYKVSPRDHRILSPDLPFKIK